MEVYLGTIVAWAPNFAPVGWQFCNGQLLPVQQYQALYALLGTKYGGDGINNFGLPNLNGRVPVGANTNGGMGGALPPGVTAYTLGQTGGSQAATLNIQNMPQHTHAATTTTTGLNVSGLTASIPASSTGGNTNTPGPNASLAAYEDTGAGAVDVYTTGNTNTTLKPVEISGGTVNGNVNTSISPTGTANPIPVDIRQPYQALNYIICVEGFWPQRP